MRRRGPDENWEGSYDEIGWVPASYLERVAICVIDGGCTQREANVIANNEEQARGMNWTPFRGETIPGLAKSEPSMLEYSRKLVGR
ncbi:MAG: hypothetical protein QM778_29345 [Myxococcales bacterium]